ncbi:MAG: hypothetical protein U5R48_18445 [Gammaproteobacteria bacterium]|nr:hypothetical protein [Gammaproteobacteria bacterium]
MTATASSRSRTPRAQPSGAGVKGPMANAAVEVFELDPAAVDLRGASVATGSTNANARIEGLALPDDLGGSLLIVFSVDDDTIDLTTGGRRRWLSLR